jgi:hypothetical protein
MHAAWQRRIELPFDAASYDPESEMPILSSEKHLLRCCSSSNVPALSTPRRICCVLRVSINIQPESAAELGSPLNVVTKQAPSFMNPHQRFGVVIEYTASSALRLGASAADGMSSHRGATKRRIAAACGSDNAEELPEPAAWTSHSWPARSRDLPCDPYRCRRYFA